MLLFLYGEDTYRLRHKLNEMKEKYISASLGDTNLCVLDGKTATSDEIIRQVLAFPFLAKSRLVIIENLLMSAKKTKGDPAPKTQLLHLVGVTKVAGKTKSDKTAGVQEKIGEFLEKVPESTVLVFAEFGNPDKRTSLFKKLSKLKMAQEFKPLDEMSVKKWIREEVQRVGGEITPDAVERLFISVGADLWRLSNEIMKLVTYNPKITGETVELLVRAQIQSDIFKLIDAVASSKQKLALKELHELLANGENELYILSMIVYQYRNMLVIKDFVNRGVSSQWELAKTAGLHPFVAGKTLSLVRNYNIDDLKNIYAKLLEQDLAIKTGKMEPQTALDLLVLDLAK